MEEIFLKLLRKYGKQGWWPAKTRFEVIVGALLTQNTNWNNVEKAIGMLRKKRMLSMKKLAKAELSEIEEAVKPAGYYKQKARRLKDLSAYILKKHRSLKRFFSRPLRDIRRELLSLEGIGRETADSILLYAGDKLVFPIDTYTFRMCKALGYNFRNKEGDYERMRELFECSLPKDIGVYKEFHALIVRAGKECGKDLGKWRVILKSSCS